MIMTEEPNVRDLTLAYARAIAVAERLAHELDNTVSDLISHVRPEGSDVGQNGPNGTEEGPREQSPRRRR